MRLLVNRIIKNGLRQVTLLVTCLLIGFQAVSQDPNFHIYLSFGQSNMAGAGDIEAQDLTGVDARFQFMKPQNCPSKNQYAGNWYTGVPPLWGCSGGIGPSDYFGRTMAENLASEVKIGVVVVAVPGCKIELFGKTGYEGLDTYKNVPAQYNGSAYAWLLDLAKKAQKDGVIKGFLLHQGESNSGDQQWPNKVKAVYDNLLKDLALNAEETPLLAGELLYSEFNSCCSGHNRIVATLPNVIPNAHVISAAGLPGKDVYHFNSEGNREFGRRYAEKMLELLPPTVSVKLTSPGKDTTVVVPSEIYIEAEVSDPNAIQTLQFYVNGQQIGNTEWVAPYFTTFSATEAGTYEVTAVVSTANGTQIKSESVKLTANLPRAPFRGLTHTIPGRIEAEDYDVGGHGIAYNDLDKINEGGSDYRAGDAVDVEETQDVDGAYNVGYIRNGEWLAYTVNVQNTDSYDLDLRMAADGDGKTLHIELDGEDVTGPISVHNTTGWQTWETVSVQNIALTEGKHDMRIVFDSDYMNLNYMRFNGIVTGDNTEAETIFKVYPNPYTQNGFKIFSIGEFSYQITEEANGQLLETGKGTNSVTAGQHLKTGLYILKVSTKNGLSVQKIIKQ